MAAGHAEGNGGDAVLRPHVLERPELVVQELDGDHDGRIARRGRTADREPGQPGPFRPLGGLGHGLAGRQAEGIAEGPLGRLGWEHRGGRLKGRTVLRPD